MAMFGFKRAAGFAFAFALDKAQHGHKVTLKRNAAGWFVLING